MSSDTLWSSISYAGTIIAGFYGVYATVTDFRANRHGKKILLPRGYIGISLLIVASFLGLIADIHRNHDEKAREQGENDTAHTINDTSLRLALALKELNDSTRLEHDQLQKAGVALRELQRLSLPLGHFDEFAFVWQIPADSPLVKTYLERVRASEPMVTTDWGPLHGQYFRSSLLIAAPGDPLFPISDRRGERELYALSQIAQVIARFAPKGEDTPDYSIYGKCDPKRTVISRKSINGPVFLVMRCETSVVEKSPEVYSRVDLLGSILTIEFDDTHFFHYQDLPKNVMLEFQYADGTADAFHAVFRPDISEKQQISDDLFYVGEISSKNSGRPRSRF